MKVGILNFEKVNANTNTGSTRIRAYWPTKYWDEAETFVYGQKYDVMIFQKAYVPPLMEVMPGLKILDICDPDWLNTRRWAYNLSLADGVVTSTEELANYVRKMTNKPVQCIPDRHDPEWYGKPKLEHTGDAKSVAWFGYAHNATGIRYYLKDIRNLGLTLTLFADAQPSWPAMGGEVKFKKYDVKTINDDLKTQDFVFLAENPENPNFRMKSNNKEVSCWFLGLPVAHLRKELIQYVSAANRTAEAKKNYEKAVKDWHVKQSVEEWKQFIQKVQEDKLRTN